MKRVISIVMLLAVLLSFGACKTKETAVPVETTIDYASPEAMYGHTGQTEPVGGVFQLWSVEGLQNMHKYPDANFELLCNIDAKGAEDAVGNRVRVKIVKNKVAPPFRKVELDIYFGKGVSAMSSLLDGAVKYGLIDKKGAWYTTETEKVGQGRENALTFLEQNPDFTKDIEVKLREKMFPGQQLKTKDEKEGKTKAGKAAGAAASEKAKATEAPADTGVAPEAGATADSSAGSVPPSLTSCSRWLWTQQ